MHNQAELFDKLDKLSKSEEYPFHMPGHKRNPESGICKGIQALDITEIEGFDNLHHAQGILKDAMENASNLYGSRRTFFLVNGSSCGILAAISSVVGEKDTLILGRNAHTSAYHGVYMTGCRVVSLYPEMSENSQTYGVIKAADLKRIIDANPKAKAVLITSPTYDGFVSDIEEFSRIVHEAGMLLIVDEAHGAHFGLDERVPKSSVTLGADLVIQSVHKTLPALTQTALLHICSDRVCEERVERFLRIYQTSSPSYLLMGSIDHCIKLMREKGRELFDAFFVKREKLLKELQTLKHLRICMAGEVQDPCKLRIETQPEWMSGRELFERLLMDYHLQMEMSDVGSVLAILTVMDTQEGFERLAKALKEIDAGLERRAFEKKQIRSLQEVLSELRAAEGSQPDMTVREAMDLADANKETVKFEDARGRIATDYLYIYPPGIPILLPGERITEKLLELVLFYEECGLTVQGLSDGRISVIR